MFRGFEFMKQLNGNGVVACVHPLPAQEGAKVLEAEGNAFDAAITTAFVQMIVTPFSCGVGGMVSANLWESRTREHLVIDGYMRAGSLATEDMWAAEYVGEADVSGASLFDDNRSVVGYTSICTPGAVAGLAEIHRRFASMPWAELLGPAIRVAREGHIVPITLARQLVTPSLSGYEPDMLSRINTTEECARLYLNPDGTLLRQGQTIRNPDYADTLEIIAMRGAEEFYRGDLAREIAQDIQAHGGFVTLEDLNEFETRAYLPPSGKYGAYEVFSNGAPGGGPLLIEALNSLDGVGLGELDPSDLEYARYLASTLQLVNQDRRSYLGDPRFVGKEPQDVLTSQSQAERIREAVLRGVVGGELPEKEDTDTTHLTVVDRAGNIASITHTLGNHSGVVTRGLGFLYNNGMNRFDPRPGHASSIAPRKARLHLMMPAIAFRQDEPIVAWGAPGFNSILGAMVQTFTNVVDYGMNSTKATTAPRIYAEGSKVWVETQVRSDVVEGLRSQGHEIIINPGSLAGSARIQMVVIEPDGNLDAASDPRGEYGVVYARSR